MKVLIACEESQTVCKAFRARGHEAYSCDIQEPSGGHPEWHILGDALKAIEGGQVTTMDGQAHDVGKWDMLIAHPPCTYLSKAGGNRLRIDGFIQQDRYERGQKAAEFFLRFLDADIPRIAVENPVPLKIFGLPPYSQIIQPYMFGDEYLKMTCLWLKHLPPLFATDIVVPTSKWVSSSDHRAIKRNDSWARSGRRSQKDRSKTFPGIAAAMADQWGGPFSWGHENDTGGRRE